MIYCIWYPSGGFGHFVNAVITLHGSNFERPSNKLIFSKKGNSHNLDLIVPKWLHGRWTKNFDFDAGKNYSVLIDNGINNEHDIFKSSFKDAVTIKICYSDTSWPVVAKTMIEKAMNSSLQSQLTTDNWPSNADWAVREKYFLYLRDHRLRHQWKPNSVDCCLFIDDMFEYTKFYNVLSKHIEVEEFHDLWMQWRAANSDFIDPVTKAMSIMASVYNQEHIDLRDILDLWTQAIVYYFIWIKFEFEVPHNDHSNWFANTTEIITMLNKYKVYH
jgi:hypothetical protein